MKCANCQNDKFIIKKYTKEFNVKGKKIKTEITSKFCSKCNNLIYDEKLDQEATKKVIKEYLDNYGIDPQKIIDFRKKYNLSQELFSKIIGCAKKTLISYEKGLSIPNDAYMIILKTILENVEDIKPIIEANKDNLTNKEYSKIEKNIYTKIGNNLKYSKPTENNGYTTLSIDKLKNVIAILTKKGIHKTKLLKELFYVDFKCYKENGYSMTGLEYARINYGPVPDNYETILNKLVEDNFINIEKRFNENYEENIITIINNENKIILTEEEKKIIKEVSEYFKYFTVKELVDFSHEEIGYIKTNPKEIISYDYAFDLKI